MASVNDYGGPTDSLAAVPFGGVGGWAEAVAAALGNSDTPMPDRLAQYVKKSGDTMTGDLKLTDPTQTFGGIIEAAQEDGLNILKFWNPAKNLLGKIKVGNPTHSDHAATKDYVDLAIPAGMKVRAGTAVLSGAPESNYNVPGLTNVTAFYACNGDPTANSGQVLYVVPSGANVRIGHSFNGGAYRIYWIAMGT